MPAQGGRSGTYRGSYRLPQSWLAVGALVLLLSFISHGCGGGGDETGEGIDTAQLRLRFIRSVGEGFIVPTFLNMETAAQALVDLVEDFCTAPDITKLVDAQMKWREVVGLWSESEFVQFGPAARNLVHDDIDVTRGRHGDADRIEARIAGGGEIVARNLATSTRGIEGVEYLLFGNMKENEDVLGDYTAATGEGRCEYLNAITIDLHANIREFSDSWRPGGGNYVNAWNTAGDANNTTYPFVQDAVRELMGEMEFVFDDLVNVKIAGYKRGARRPWVDQKPESWRSGNSIANILRRIQAAEMIYVGLDRNTGQDGFGIDDYLRQTGETSLDNRIQDEFDAVLGSDAPLRTLDALGATLEAAVHSHPTLLDDAETDSRKLLRTLKRDLTVEQLGVEFPGFNDADGD